MRAVGFMKYGGPEVLEIYDLPETHVGLGQVRIRNRAATVNPTDTMSRGGMLSNQQKGCCAAPCSRNGSGRGC
jgi:NADPH:quinone reductase